MLDIALLTANASQLKYILQVGDKHEFYSLMLGLITTSIILQVRVHYLILVCLIGTIKMTLMRGYLVKKMTNRQNCKIGIFTSS